MEGRVKEQIKNILVALINRNVPIESVRTNRSKNVAYVKVCNFADKLEILQGITTTSEYMILDHETKLKKISWNTL